MWHTVLAETAAPGPCKQIHGSAAPSSPCQPCKKRGTHSTGSSNTSTTPTLGQRMCRSVRKASFAIIARGISRFLTPPTRFHITPMRSAIKYVTVSATSLTWGTSIQTEHILHCKNGHLQNRKAPRKMGEKYTKFGFSYFCLFVCNLLK